MNEIKSFLKSTVLTLNKSNLEVVGAFEVFIKNKEMKRVGRKGNISCLLYLETYDGKYKGIFTVGTEEYNSATVGKGYGKKTVITNHKYPDFQIMTDSDDPYSAIDRQSLGAKITLFALVLISFLFLHTLMTVIIPFVFLLIYSVF